MSTLVYAGKGDKYLKLWTSPDVKWFSLRFATMPKIPEWGEQYLIWGGEQIEKLCIAETGW